MGKYVRAVAIGLVAGVVGVVLLTFVYQNVFDAIGWGVPITVVGAYLSLNLAGNRKIPAAASAEKQAALQLSPPPGKAVIYVFREGFNARLLGLDIQIDGKAVTQLTAPKFTCVVVSAGSHTLTCAFAGLVGNQPSGFEFTAPSDGVAAIGIKLKPVFGKTVFDFSPITDAAAARAKVSPMPMVVAESAEI